MRLRQIKEIGCSHPKMQVVVASCTSPCASQPMQEDKQNGVLLLDLPKKEGTGGRQLAIQ